VNNKNYVKPAVGLKPTTICAKSLTCLSMMTKTFTLALVGPLVVVVMDAGGVCECMFVCTYIVNLQNKTS